MGAWGIGLYSSDFALDMRASVKAVARLPFANETLLDHLCDLEPAAANDPQDSDHTTFWLTVADQFAKRGIDCPRARNMALAIIADGADEAMMASLGMDEKSLVKRRAMLAALGQRIAAPIGPTKPRAVLKAPQKLLLDVGDVYAYPVHRHDRPDGSHYYEPINPYLVGKDWPAAKAWTHDAWGVFAVVQRGLAFGFLAWYRPVVMDEVVAATPELAQVMAPHVWGARNPGTLTPRHLTAMQIKLLGRLNADPSRLKHFFPETINGVACAANDISIANSLNVETVEQPAWTQHPLAAKIHGLGDISLSHHDNAADISGRWQGEFRYQKDVRPPGVFMAELIEQDGNVNGRIEEKVVTASVAGRRVSRLVRFTKQYDGSGGKTHAVDYAGEVNDGATQISGRWLIADKSSGQFVMNRI